MARNTGLINFTGTLGNLTGYKRKGAAGTFLRAKGSLNRQRIMTDPKFRGTRQVNQEWKACTETAKNVSIAIHEISSLSDYNFWGKLIAACKKTQVMDAINKKGERSLLISESPCFIESLVISKFNLFAKIMVSPLLFSIDRQDGNATIHFPKIVKGTNFINPRNRPFYRFIAELGTLSDMVYDKRKKMYKPVVINKYLPVVQKTDWHSWSGGQTGIPAFTMWLAIANWVEKPGMNLVLSVGVEFGEKTGVDEIKGTKYAGAGTILKIA